MRTLLLSAVALAALPLSNAAAFEMRTQTWATSTVTLRVNPDVQTTLPDHYDVLLDAAAKVDANASALRFDLIVDNDVVSASSNGENELNFTNDSTLLCGSVGCAWTVSNATTILESDVFLKLSHSWALDDLKTSSIAYSGSGRPLLNVAMHEMLHTLGAKHENELINIMGVDWNVVSTNGDRTEAVVSEDTTEGLVSVNGPRATAIHDVSVMHWKFNPATSGDYSQHMRSKVTNLSGVELSKTLDPITREPIYLTSPGSQIKVEMTLENRGSSTEVTGLGVYWSANSLISTLDTLLFSSTATLAVNTPFEHTVTVTVPATGTVGTTYYVGAIIDRDGDISEMNETNNAAYIAAIKLQ
jgi:hypothetical protein